MIFSSEKEISETPLRAAITELYCSDEKALLELLLAEFNITKEMKEKIAIIATKLVTEVREQRIGKSGLDSFLYQYHLSSEEGMTLMCLAEALLRIPDTETIDRLIKDKITKADWEIHLGKSESLFVNAATWGLMLSGKIISAEDRESTKLTNIFKSLVKRSGEPVIRKAIVQAMRILGKQFVMEESIEKALKRAKEFEKKGYLYSYDMLGEAARTADDAEEYFQTYQQAIVAIGKNATHSDVSKNPGISVKLSALHPRYEFSQQDRVVTEISARLKTLALQAKAVNIGLTVDAEEANRLDISLDIIERVYCDGELDGWEGFGLALQSYQKRAMAIIDWLVDLAKKHKRRWMVRLIKGAYWDSEIKSSQELGLEGYPVFTRKMNTDLSFLTCAQKILKFPTEIYPQFATHNAHSVATILELTDNSHDKSRTDYEFQCLHGMGQTLYDCIVGKENMDRACRIYAPVGNYQDLLPYLVRRLLENGANTSFVNRLVDATQPISDLIADPEDKIKKLTTVPHPGIPLPKDIYLDTDPQIDGEERKNSQGIDLTNRNHLSNLKKEMEKVEDNNWEAAPTFSLSSKRKRKKEKVINPYNHKQTVGYVTEAVDEEIQLAIEKASSVAFEWDKTSVEVRAKHLEKAADLFEEHHAELMVLLIREGGKSIPDALSELREAVDFCRYYAIQARIQMTKPSQLPGPTGENNQLQLHGRGPVVCISPWNFPLAIFTGQVTAALVCGNPVLAKPANQTPLVAARAVELLHEAGIPKEVLQLLPSKGSMIGKTIIPDPRIKGVVFTGSTETAQIINKTLADRKGDIVPLIAETGGQNAMIVDSSALPEQVVLDVIASAFNSAGQRCSALRVLFIQEDIADKLIKMLKGAMQELVIGDPSLLNTDVGPVIDNGSQSILEAHIEEMKVKGKLIFQNHTPSALIDGSFVGPSAFEIPNIEILEREIFGPVLHLIRYKASELDTVIDSVNSTGYGLTLGIHSRVEETVRYIQSRIRVGNSYVNRNMVGAVVGVQPFGGEGLSGTGPKAGGPHYLLRLCTERTLSINTAAVGGNASLMCLQDDAD